MKTNQTAKLGGRAKIRVLMPDGSLKSETDWQKNLILNDGIEDLHANNSRWAQAVTYCRAGSGTSATKEALDGTFAQSGTTVTRSTGTGEFDVGDVGNHIKFGTGEETMIVSRTSATEVEVRDSATVSATTLDRYKTTITALDSQLKSSNTLDGASGANDETPNTTNGSLTIKRTFNFTAEVGTVNYNEVGFSRAVSSDLVSRIVLDSTVTVEAGEQLQIVYELVLTCATWLDPTALTPTITGWPYLYDVTGITATASNFDVTLSDDHHYSVGDEITISDALPTKANIASFTSDPTEFTVTTSTAHGLTVSDSIEIEGATPSGYDGTWTVAAVDSTTVFRVTSAINPGAGSGGTVRISTPGSWYNGTWTIASIPTSDSIRITSAIDPVDAGEGSVVGTLAGEVEFYGYLTVVPFSEGSSSEICDFRVANDYYSKLWRDGSEVTNLGLASSSFLTSNASTGTRSKTKSAWDSVDLSFTREIEYDIDEGNFDDIKQFAIQGGSGSTGSAIVFTFDQNQRKDSGYTLKVGYKIAFRPDLP